MRLREKRCLITGGSRGLGRALCRVFAAEGAKVAFTYTREPESAEQTLAEVPGAKAYRVSVLDAEGTIRMVSELEGAWGAIDVLVNNAGVSQNLPMALLEEDDFDRVMDINVKGTYLTSRAVARGMMRRKSGVILNMGSLAGERMIEAPIHYCASKAAIRGLTEAMAKELSRHQIRVLNLAPELLEDSVGKNLPDYRLRDYLDHVPLRRVGTLNEVARFAAFLVSDENAYMNGETVVMDGGLGS